MPERLKAISGHPLAASIVEVLLQDRKMLCDECIAQTLHSSLNEIEGVTKVLSLVGYPRRSGVCAGCGHTRMVTSVE